LNGLDLELKIIRISPHIYLQPHWNKIEGSSCCGGIMNQRKPEEEEDDEHT
jgi:hypothetical protein